MAQATGNQDRSSSPRLLRAFCCLEVAAMQDDLLERAAHVIAESKKLKEWTEQIR
ncbi:MULTISPECIES: hypothetical protein [Bradyrhizobium]|uniref:hypothetical protein n=1 Tax=Bradyrhizobium TaxID=374 RepID=UPI0003F502F3|nr:MULTISPECIES: hypothetical protein [Bradyrhizobium]UFW50543.1 hypothetical protein BaraCB756_05685 [Bradyrhizobium arachidis]